jgi:hypothetical protein
VLSDAQVKTGCDPTTPPPGPSRWSASATAPRRRSARRPTPPSCTRPSINWSGGPVVPSAEPGRLPDPVPEPRRPGDTGWHHRRQLPARRGGSLLGQPPVAGSGPAHAVSVLRRRPGRRPDPDQGWVPPGRAAVPAPGRTGRDAWATLAQTMDQAGKLNAPDRPLALAAGAAGDVYLRTRSWSTPPSHTTAAARGSWPSHRSIPRGRWTLTAPMTPPARSNAPSATGST